jgi:hypothetical protein
MEGKDSEVKKKFKKSLFRRLVNFKDKEAVSLLVMQALRGR